MAERDNCNIYTYNHQKINYLVKNVKIRKYV